MPLHLTSVLAVILSVMSVVVQTTPIAMLVLSMSTQWKILPSCVWLSALTTLPTISWKNRFVKSATKSVPPVVGPRTSIASPVSRKRSSTRSLNLPNTALLLAMGLVSTLMAQTAEVSRSEVS